MMCEKEEALLAFAAPAATYHGRPDRSMGVGFKAAVACHFCGKVGHYKAGCWVAHPEELPKN